MPEAAYTHGKRQLFRFNSGKLTAGQRLDQYLLEKIPALSLIEAYKLIDLGGVHLNGRRARTCSTKVHSDVDVEVYIDGLPLDIFRLSAEHILYQDDYLIVINKPAGIETQPTHARYKGTLYDAILAHLGPVPGQKKHELGMVQRLDRGTSGVMVFSTHQRSHKGLSHIFMEHRVDKRYLALVANPPGPAQAEICSLLARTHRDNKMVSVERGGKEAITRYQTLKSSEWGALVEVELLTGRSHQIRVHLSEAGSPLLGDTLYGGVSQILGWALKRPMLHAVSLSFKHPVTDDELAFTLPFSGDMLQVHDAMFPVG